MTSEERIFTQPLALRVNGSLSGKTSRRVKALQLAASAARSIISRLCRFRDSSNRFSYALVIVALLKIPPLSRNNSIVYPSFLLLHASVYSPSRKCAKWKQTEPSCFSRPLFIIFENDKSARVVASQLRILSVPPAISFARATVEGLKDDFARCAAYRGCHEGDGRSRTRARAPSMEESPSDATHARARSRWRTP